MRLFLSVWLLGLVAGVAAAEDKQEKPAGVQPIKVITVSRSEPLTYEKDIEPILVNKCLFCHTGLIQEGKLDMATYETLLKGGKRGPPLVPGKSAESLLIQLSGKTARPFMPPKVEEPLAPEELALLKLWIDQGAKPPSSRRERPKIILAALPATVTPVRAVAVSPDKSAVVAGRANQIHVYDAGSGAHVRTLVAPELTTADQKPVAAAHLSIVEALAFSPDGKYLASGSFQEAVLWDAATGTLQRRWTGFADRVVALAFSSDSKLLATAGGAPTEDGEIKVFDVSTGDLVVEIKNGHSDTVFGVCFSPDGKLLATCAADKFVKVFEIPDGKFVKAFEGHTHHVLDVGWKADGKLLASGGADNAIKVWDYEKGEQTRTINGHSKQVTRLLFIGASQQIVTCSGDQTVRFWDVTSGSTVRNFGGSNDFVYAVGVSPDGSVMAAGGEEGVVRLYNGSNGQLLKSLLPPGVPAAKAK